MHYIKPETHEFGIFDASAGHVICLNA